MKITGIILAIVGVLAVIAGFIVPVVGVAAGVSAVNSTDSTTYGTGELVKVLNLGKLVASPGSPYDENVPITSVRNTRADTAAMEQQDAKDAGATIFVTDSTTTRTDTEEDLTVSEATFAFNPADSQLLNCCGASLGDNANVDFQGVMPLKFPFSSPQDTVELFNTTLQTTVPTVYQGEVEKFDMTLYRYTQSIEPTQTPAPPTSVPASLAAGLVAQLAPELADQVPADGNIDMFEFYSADNEFLVEPVTGQIVEGNLKELTTFRLDGGTQDIVTKVEAVAGSDPEKADEGAADIKSSADQLAMVGMATPILFGLGIVLLIVGIVLIVMGGKKKKAALA
jgi:hypothetical protein